MTDREFEIAKIVLEKGILAVIALLIGFWINRRLEKYKQLREDEIRERERHFIPRVEFDLSCNFYGPEGDFYIVEVLMDVNNKGNVRRQFKSMLVRLRGIKSGSGLDLWTERKSSRLVFPEILVKEDFVPGGEGNYYFVEPGVKQVFTYVTRIPSDIRYILAHVRFQSMVERGENKYENVFTEERLFRVPDKGMVRTNAA